MLALCLGACSLGRSGNKGGIDALLTTSGTDASAGQDPNSPAILSALTVDPSIGKAWENPGQGSRGVISSLVPEDDEGRSCYAFTSTRESFEGIYLYEGSACRTPQGVLVMKSLVRR